MNDFDLGFDLSEICLLDEAAGEEKASSNEFLSEKFISTFLYWIEAPGGGWFRRNHPPPK
jgi:hypothetical protein